MHNPSAAPIPNVTPLGSRAPELALVVVTMTWGGTFLAVKYGLNFSSPLFFVACRFAAASIAVCLVSFKAMKGLTRREMIAGSAIGAAIASGYGAQTVGLQEISSSESAFLTALYVPLVPLLQWIVFRRSPHPMLWLGAVLAFVGVVLLTGGDASNLTLNRGQILTLVGSFAIAIEIVVISHFARSVDPRRVTVVQLAVASLLAFCSMPIAGETVLPKFSWILVGLVAALGMASALIQLTMNWAQRSVDPARAAIIYAGEPIWAGLFGRIAGERLGQQAWIGGALVVLGVVVSELRKPKKKVVPTRPRDDTTTDNAAR